ncbi:MAG TPA: hypothetical protein VGD31_07235 [Sphingobacteriaceae bacterium]
MVQKVTRGLKRKYFSVTSFGTSSSQEDTQFQDKIKVFFDNSIENVIARIGPYKTDANGHTTVSTPAVEKILHYETLLPVNIRRITNTWLNYLLRHMNQNYTDYKSCVNNFTKK